MSVGDEHEQAEFMARARQIREDFRSAVDDLNSRLSRLEGHARRAQETIGEGLDTAQEGIRSHPVTAVAVAASVGFLLGVFFYRRR